MNPTPLCVDLDGTVIKGDASIESMLLAVKSHPFRVLQLLVSFPSLASLKVSLAQLAQPNPALAVRNTEFLEFLNNERAQGRKVLLVSASTDEVVKRYAKVIGGFDEAVGSSSTRNLKGKEKAAYLIERFGERGFDYAGNSSADLPVWKKSKHALVVNADRSVATRAQKIGNISHTFAALPHGVKLWARTIRVHQWAKNALLLVPLFLSHSITLDAVMNVILGICSFCLVASSIYIFNDLLDIESDRQHPSKRNRPIPAGFVTLQQAMKVALCLVVTGFGISFLIGAPFVLLLLFYAFATTAYSLFLKRVVLIDIFVLAGLYALRIFAGGVAASVMLSPWLLAYSLFLFLSLAAAKRFAELSNVQARGEVKVQGRGYGTDDRLPIGLLGSNAGYLSVVIFTLYISSNEVKSLYSSPHFLWGIVPVLLYWVSRIWLLAYREVLHEDPVIFALRDWVSYVSLVTCSIFILAAV